MATFHDKVKIEDFQYDKDSGTCFYSCPCGNFCTIKEGLKNREDMATWPSCSLLVNVIYVKDQFTCGETVPAPSTSKELVKCWRRLLGSRTWTWGMRQAGKLKCGVTGFFTGTIILWFAVHESLDSFHRVLSSSPTEASPPHDIPGFCA